MSAINRLGIDANLLESFSISNSQAQTRDTFAFKWSQEHTYNSESLKNLSKE